MSPDPAAVPRLRLHLPWIALAALLLLAVPLFLRMPPTVDVAFYDVCAETLLRGGILDRDVVMLQPPGMAWLVAGVHALLGGGVIALRAVDLLIVAGIIALLRRWQRSMLTSTGVAWLVVTLAGFYLTTSEWVHAQPDTWMLVPALAALTLRRHLLEADIALRAAMAFALAEGLLWGIGCLIKPFVFLPGVMCWLLCAYRAGWGEWRTLARQAIFVLLGGALVGLVWVGWLWIDGGWPFYLQKLADWSGRYYAADAPRWQRFGPMLAAFPPWGVAHLVAVPYALWVLIRRRNAAAAAVDPQALLGVFYLGWLIEGNFVQSQNHYHILPSTLLAIAVASAPMAHLAVSRSAARVGLAGVLTLSILLQPAFARRRLCLWSACWNRPTTPAFWNALALDSRFTPDWEQLALVEEFLREQHVDDGQLTSFSMTTTHLYTHLRVKPASPYLFLSLVLHLYPNRREQVLAELRASPERFIVADVCEAGLTRTEAEAGDATALPPAFPQSWRSRYPWSLPTVFRAGRFVVQAR